MRSIRTAASYFICFNRCERPRRLLSIVTPDVRRGHLEPVINKVRDGSLRKQRFCDVTGNHWPNQPPRENGKSWTACTEDEHRYAGVQNEKCPLLTSGVTNG